MLFVFGSGLSHCSSSPLFYGCIPMFCCCVTLTLALLSISPTQGTEVRSQNSQYNHHIANKNSGPLPPSLYINSECLVFVIYLTAMMHGSGKSDSPSAFQGTPQFYGTRLFSTMLRQHPASWIHSKLLPRVQLNRFPCGPSFQIS